MDDELTENLSDDTTPSEEDYSSDEEVIPQDSSEEEAPSDEEVIYDRRILDENNQEIINPDLTLGHLEEDKIITYHPGQSEIAHYLINHIHLSDGTNLFANSEEEYDPRIIVTNREKGYWEFRAETPEPQTIIVDWDEEGNPIEETIIPEPVKVTSASIKRIIDSPAISAWEETENIYRYILYTEKELADIEFLAEGPERLSIVEETSDEVVEVLADILGDTTTEDQLSEIQDEVDGLTEVVADLAGSDIEDRMIDVQEAVDDLLLTLAELLGGGEEE